MSLDTITTKKPVSKAPTAMDLLDSVADSASGPGALGNVSVRPAAASAFFGGGGDESKTFDITRENDEAAFSVSAPIAPQVPNNSDPLAGALSLSPVDVARPAEALLDSFSPDISALSRMGLPLSGVDIPDEKAIRDMLRKILRRL